MKLKNSYLMLIMFIISCFPLNSCYLKKSAFQKENKFSKEKIKFGKEKIGDADSSLLLKKIKGKVIILFTEEFDDTLLMTQNGKFLKRWLMVNDTNKNPGYKSFDTTLNIKRKDEIQIYLLRQKKKVSFPIDDSHPFVTVQRYDGIWYINSRFYVMITK